MKNIFSALFLLSIAFSQASNGTVIASYDSTSSLGVNPLLQGWATNNIPLWYGSSSTVNGIPVWQINDTGTNVGDALGYYKNINPAIFNGSWEYSLTLNIPTSPTQPSTDFYISNGSTDEWSTRVYRASSGNLVIDNGSLGQSYQTPIGDNDFFKVSLKYNQATSLVDVYFNNAIAISGFLSSHNVTLGSLIVWGTGSSVETGIANWENVTLSTNSTIPEPSTMFLFGSGFFALIYGKRRTAG